MSMMQNKEILRSYIVEMFSRGNVDVADRLLSPDYVNRDAMPGQDPGPQGEKQRAMMFRRAFPDMQVSVADMVAEGDKVSARLVSRGTQRGEFLGIPPTGRQASWQVMVIYRVADGRLVERWGVQDLYTIVQQLGARCELQAMPAAEQRS